jgi:hypothetical protein
VKAQPSSEDELEKRLDADLLQGAAIICIDNCDHLLEGAALCQMLTQETRACACPDSPRTSKYRRR